MNGRLMDQGIAVSSKLIHKLVWLLATQFALTGVRIQALFLENRHTWTIMAKFMLVFIFTKTTELINQQVQRHSGKDTTVAFR